MKFPNFTPVFLTAILSGTTILITAIALNFTGAIDISWTKEGLQLRLESEAKSLPEASDAFADSL